MVVFAGGGDDTIKLSPTGGFSFHFLDGGSGNDTLDLSALAGPVNVALDTGLGSGAAPPGMLLFSSIENVIGSNAADHIAASSAVNILTGGGEADTFVFNDLNAVRNGTTFDAAKRDTITDFVHGTDRINLSHIDANTGTGGTQHFSGISFWNGTGAEFTAANQLKFHYETINGQEHTIIDGNINGNTGTDFQIDLVRHIALTSSDFILT
ncbi:M10 family metallopeptidase C-terminal domain-containing protein [Bradyrhizobium ottawaense]|uniref:M10 family metallopeptidase C-terminal domain-containing protein n=1 Tax=Bradyrhizobium ottawaense TaxID=931866 RepID=UPI0038512CC4